MKAALLRLYKHRRYSPLLAKSSLSVSAISAVIDILVLIIGRTTVLVCIAIPSIARMRLSSYYDVSAVRQAL